MNKCHKAFNQKLFLKKIYQLSNHISLKGTFLEVYNPMFLKMLQRYQLFKKIQNQLTLELTLLNLYQLIIEYLQALCPYA